jgi:hypothetical protein
LCISGESHTEVQHYLAADQVCFPVDWMSYSESPREVTIDTPIASFQGAASARLSEKVGIH